MSKKDFKNINTNHVYEAMENALAQDVYGAHDVQATHNAHNVHEEHEAQNNLISSNTCKNKKLKLPRINMSFSHEIYEYIKTMSKVSGISMTEFVNSIIKNHMDKHIDQYNKTVEIRNNLND